MKSIGERAWDHTPCSRCGESHWEILFPTDPDGLCGTCVARDHGIDPDDGDFWTGCYGYNDGSTVHGLANAAPEWRGYSLDYVARVLDHKPDDGRPLWIFRPFGSRHERVHEMWLVRAYSDELEFYLEVSWSPERGLRHALRFHRNATPLALGQLSKARTLMAFILDAPKNERGRPFGSRYIDDPETIREAVATVWSETGKEPTTVATAKRLGVSTDTLRRTLNAFGMTWDQVIDETNAA